MRRSKLSFGGKRTSASDASAMAIMCRARPAIPPTSPFAWPSGLPIMRVMSAAMVSALASMLATAASHKATRSATLVRLKPAKAARAWSSTRPMCASSASGTSTSGARV